jgi:hypothetical protein
MTINGQEVDFDMDNRKDNVRFVKAFTLLQKKQERGQINDEDMETFLNGCIKPEQVKTLLADGKISTLTKIFVEFFRNAIEQYGQVSRTYEEVADLFTELKGLTETVSADYKAINDRIEATSAAMEA